MKDDYYKNKDSVDEYIRLAKDVNGAALIDKLKKYLPSNSTLLEIGTGPGTDWNILQSAYIVTGSDYSPEFLKRLRSIYPTGQFLELDATTLVTQSVFDGIYSNKVLHHLKNSELCDSITRQHAILKTSGIICHSFWKGEDSEYFKGLYVQYHTKKTLQYFFEDYFEILLLEEYSEFEDGDSILLIGRKSGKPR